MKRTINALAVILSALSAMFLIPLGMVAATDLWAVPVAAQIEAEMAVAAVSFAVEVVSATTASYAIFWGCVIIAISTALSSLTGPRKAI